MGLLGGTASVALVRDGFIAWSCYFHTGGDSAALQKTLAGMSFGAVIAGIAWYLVRSGMLAALGTLAAPVIITVTVFALVIVAGISLCQLFRQTYMAMRQLLALTAWKGSESMSMSVR